MGKVVVIGAGYAGVRAAKAAELAGAEVVLLDTDGLHHFGPRLAGVAAGSANERDGFAPVGSLMNLRCEVATVKRIDLVTRQVLTADGGAHPYDALVVTVGAIPSQPPIPGLAEHAQQLKSSDDARRIRHAVTRASCAVVIGGGATGVQIAGELAASVEGLTVEVVERAPRLVPELPRLISRQVARILRSRNVLVHVATQVERVDAAGVDLSDGTRVDGVVIWAGGFKAIGHELLPDAPIIDGRLDVRGTLALESHPEVFVAGDAAAHVDLLGRQVGMSAQIAVQAGKAAGRNAARVASGREAVPALLLDLGRVVSMGGGRGVAQLGPVPIGLFGTDRLVPLLHELI
ncbi:MAG: NADH dehydrogenase, partial [Glaciecola sp.]